MEINDTHSYNGSLQISSEAIAKIAKMATMEIEGVAQVSLGAANVENLLGRLKAAKPIQVKAQDGVADIDICIIVDYGVHIREISQKIQENVKQSVQNMTSITVARVNVMVTGVHIPQVVQEEEEG